MDSVKKKMILYYALLGVVLFAMIYLVTMGKRPARKSEAQSSVYVEIPPAKSDNLSDSKFDAYDNKHNLSRGQNHLDDYWASLESSNPGSGGNPDGSAGTEKDIVSEVTSGESSSGRLSDEELLKKYYGEDFFEEDEKEEEPVVEKPVQQPSKPRAASSSGGGGGGSARPVSVAPETPPAPKEEPARAAQPRSGGVVSSMRGNRKAGVVSSGQEETVREREKEMGSVAQGTSVPIRCMFVKDESIRTGQRVTVRILDQVELDGVVIPADTHLPAMCSLSSRLEMTINSFTMNGQLHAVNLVAYDNDGAKGLYCPGLEEIAQRSKEIGLNTASSTLSSVIGGAGITGRIVQGAIRLGENAAQMSLNNAKVTVPSGYTFYVMQEKNRY